MEYSDTKPKAETFTDECMLKKLLFEVKRRRRRKVNHSSSHAVYSGIEEQSRLMDGGGRKSGIKRPIQTAAKRRFCLTLRASERDCLPDRAHLSFWRAHTATACLPSFPHFLSPHIWLSSHHAMHHSTPSQKEDGRRERGAHIV